MWTDSLLTSVDRLQCWLCCLFLTLYISTAGALLAAIEELWGKIAKNEDTYEELSKEKGGYEGYHQRLLLLVETAEYHKQAYAARQQLGECLG